MKCNPTCHILGTRYSFSLMVLRFFKLPCVMPEPTLIKNTTWHWQWAPLAITTCDMHYLRCDPVNNKSKPCKRFGSKASDLLIALPKSNTNHSLHRNTHQQKTVLCQSTFEWGCFMYELFSLKVFSLYHAGNIFAWNLTSRMAINLYKDGSCYAPECQFVMDHMESRRNPGR